MIRPMNIIAHELNHKNDFIELRFLDLNAFNLTEITVRHGLVHCCSLHLVKMDCTGGCLVSDTQTVSRKFRLSDYGHHMEHFESNEGA